MNIIYAKSKTALGVGVKMTVMMMILGKRTS